MGIHDDRAAWIASGESKDGGKVLLVDQADYGTQHIFFDDMAHEDHHCQVDVLDIVTGQPLPY